MAQDVQLVIFKLEHLVVVAFGIMHGAVAEHDGDHHVLHVG